MRRTAVFYTVDLSVFRRQLYAYSRIFDVCCVLDSNQIKAAAGYSKYEILAGLGAAEIVPVTKGLSFESLQTYHQAHADWLFGTLAYHLQTETEPILRTAIDNTETAWPALWFFKPETVITVQEEERRWRIEIHTLTDPENVCNDIRNSYTEEEHSVPAALFSPRTQKASYLHTVERIKDDIINGNYYEMNYCQQFVADTHIADTTALSMLLSAVSPAPFSAFLRLPGKSLVCASPERFMMKTGSQLISQPIKGTRKRGASQEEDLLLKTELLNSEKERAENVMIVDLVRNDLSHNCEAGTVKVEELFGIYSYRHVHQMVSTVTGILRHDSTGLQALKAAFPMGSMTGAPKVEVMKTIAAYEPVARGIYSGSVGYISPEGDYDFNVVIRSLVYDDFAQQLSYHVGGAITADSIPEEEYEECMAKAAGILSLFNAGKVR